MDEPHGTDDADQDTVLIVEDNEGLAELYGLWLSDSYEVRTAYDALEAMDHIDEDVDVVILDRRLPEQSGEMVLERIRDRGLDCMVTIVSAVEPEIDVAEFPIDDYFTKPIDREELESAVDELLLRSEVDTAKRDLLALHSRRIALEENNRLEELTETEEYRRLEREIADIEESLPIDPQDISSIHRPDACPGCGLRWDLDVEGVVGFLVLASRVWKCRECGEIVRHRDPDNRRVAKR